METTEQNKEIEEEGDKVRETMGADGTEPWSP